MRVAAVIPNWNGLRFLKPLFESLRAQSRPFDEIVVADDGSADASAEWAESAGATVLRLEGRRGFTGAVNAGVRAVGDRADLVAILNNDVTLAPDWLERMLAGVGDSAFAAGKVLSASRPDRIDGSWDALSRGGTALRCGAGRPDGPFWSRPRQIGFAPLTAALVRRKVFWEVGGLDEAFGTYLEDVDFGLRCGSKGHVGIYVPDAVCWHVGSGTLGVWSESTVKQISRNQLLLVAKNYPSAVIREWAWQLVIAQVLWGVVAARHGRLSAWIAGKWLGFRDLRRLRRHAPHGVKEVVLRSEQEIRQAQAQGKPDWYWRMYFAVAGDSPARGS